MTPQEQSLKKNTHWLSTTLIIPLLLFGCASTNKPNFHPQEPHFKIVTYNVNWGFVRPENVADYLTKEAADIVCLQESHRHWEAFLKTRLSKEYPYTVFRENEAAGGIAIMSRYELQDVKLIEPNEGWFPALLVKAQTPVGLVQILNVHLRPRLTEQGTVSIRAYFSTEDIHCKELQGFIAHTTDDEPLIILGDFNEDEKSKAIRKLIESGFKDALSVYDKYTNTWAWKVSSGIELKNRYDHILYSRHLNSTAAGVTAVEASDHMPVVAIITKSD